LVAKKKAPPPGFVEEPTPVVQALANNRSESLN
jgi:hypothetical protein